MKWLTWSETKWFQRNLIYLKMAELWSLNSHAQRAKVGALLVKDSCIISDGYNGMPTGMSNCCEHNTSAGIKTNKEVLHAESNALMKLCKYGNATANDAVLYVTYSPCIDCAKLILQAGVKQVHFVDLYHHIDGLRLLSSAGIELYWYPRSAADYEVACNQVDFDDAFLANCVNIVAVSDNVDDIAHCNYVICNLDAALSYEKMPMYDTSYGVIANHIIDEVQYQHIIDNCKVYEQTIHFEI